MTLNNKIINLLKQRSGLLFDKAGDFDLLSSFVFKETGRTIGVTTLKRLFNYVNDDRKASEYTLNTIALYLGYNSWEQFVYTINVDSIWGYDDEETVYIHSLEKGTRIEVSYLDRKVTFEVVERNNENVLRVENVINSSLQKGDECFIYQIRKGAIIEAEKVYRGELLGNYRTNGEVNEISISTNNFSNEKIQE